jgi:DNA-binding transcriptional regulator of glucitol operon
VRRFFTRHWLWLHVAVVVTVSTFIALGWWQVVRAGAGNARSYGYAVEWPSMAAIVIFLYIRAIRMELHKADVHMVLPTLIEPTVFDTDQPVHEYAATDDDDDPELAAYNKYLSGLHDGDLEKRR